MILSEVNKQRDKWHESEELRIFEELKEGQYSQNQVGCKDGWLEVQLERKEKVRPGLPF